MESNFSHSEVDQGEILAQNLLRSLENLLTSSSWKTPPEYREIDPEMDSSEIEKLRISLVGSVAEQIDEYIIQLKKIHPETWEQEANKILTDHAHTIAPQAQQMLIESIESYK